MRALYRYAGKSRTQAAQRHLATTLAAWAAQWCVAGADAGDAFAIDAIADEAADMFASHSAMSPVQKVGAVHSGEHSHAAVQVDVDSARWRELVFGDCAPVIPDDDVAFHLLAAARTALLDALCNCSSAASTEMPDSISRGSARALSSHHDGSWLSATVSHNGKPAFLLRITASLFDDALPPRAVATSALVARRDAIAASTLNLTVQFPLAAITAGELAHWRPGMVLRSHLRLGQPLALATAESGAALAAHLGKQGGHLAVRVAAASPHASDAGQTFTPIEQSPGRKR